MQRLDLQLALYKIAGNYQSAHLNPALYACMCHTCTTSNNKGGQSSDTPQSSMVEGCAHFVKLSSESLHGEMQLMGVTDDL